MTRNLNRGPNRPKGPCLGGAQCTTHSAQSRDLEISCIAHLAHQNLPVDKSNVRDYRILLAAHLFI